MTLIIEPDSTNPNIIKISGDGMDFNISTIGGRADIKDTDLDVAVWMSGQNLQIANIQWNNINLSSSSNLGRQFHLPFENGHTLGNPGSFEVLATLPLNSVSYFYGIGFSNGYAFVCHSTPSGVQGTKIRRYKLSDGTYVEIEGAFYYTDTNSLIVYDDNTAYVVCGNDERQIVKYDFLNGEAISVATLDVTIIDDELEFQWFGRQMAQRVKFGTKDKIVIVSLFEVPTVDERNLWYSRIGVAFFDLITNTLETQIYDCPILTEDAGFQEPERAYLGIETNWLYYGLEQYLNKTITQVPLYFDWFGYNDSINYFEDAIEESETHRDLNTMTILSDGYYKFTLSNFFANMGSADIPDVSWTYDITFTIEGIYSKNWVGSVGPSGYIPVPLLWDGENTLIFYQNVSAGDYAVYLDFAMSASPDPPPPYHANYWWFGGWFDDLGYHGGLQQWAHFPDLNYEFCINPVMLIDINNNSLSFVDNYKHTYDDQLSSNYDHGFNFKTKDFYFNIYKSYEELSYVMKSNLIGASTVSEANMNAPSNAYYYSGTKKPYALVQVGESPSDTQTLKRLPFLDTVWAFDEYIYMLGLDDVENICWILNIGNNTLDGYNDFGKTREVEIDWGIYTPESDVYPWLGNIYMFNGYATFVLRKSGYAMLYILKSTT